MLHGIRIAAMLAIGSVLASAQTSVGLSTNDPKPLKDYRLPEWGYTDWQIAFGTSGYKLDQNQRNEKNESSELSLTLTPRIFIFKESEKHFTSIDGFLTKWNSFSLSKNIEKGYRNEKIESNINQWMIHLISERRTYNSSKYVRVSPEFNFLYHRDIDKYTFNYFSPPSVSKNKFNSLNRYYDINVTLGMGVGRVRNVTPVIRALRLNERLKTVNKDAEFGQFQIDQAAVEFSKYHGYQSIYDYPDKYFWNSLSAHLPELTPFESHYLNDIFKEITGERLEGSEIDAGLRITKIDGLTKFKSDFDNDKFKIKSGFLGPQLHARLYHNYSLKGQIGFTGQANWDFRINEKKYNPIENILQFQLSADHLYVVTNQILFRIKPSYSRVILKYEFDDDKYTSSLLSLNSSINFFIEDRFSINGSADWSYLKNKPHSELTGSLPPYSSYYSPMFIGFPIVVKSRSQWFFDITIHYHFGKLH
ncbi:hypothetical protein K1X84_04850 [bacterium]|nr:hypothetical protein [bacterium]